MVSERLRPGSVRADATVGRREVPHVVEAEAGPGSRRLQRGVDEPGERACGVERSDLAERPENGVAGDLAAEAAESLGVEVASRRFQQGGRARIVDARQRPDEAPSDGGGRLRQRPAEGVFDTPTPVIDKILRARPFPEGEGPCGHLRQGRPAQRLELRVGVGTEGGIGQTLDGGRVARGGESRLSRGRSRSGLFDPPGRIQLRVRDVEGGAKQRFVVEPARRRRSPGEVSLDLGDECTKFGVPFQNEPPLHLVRNDAAAQVGARGGQRAHAPEKRVLPSAAGDFEQRLLHRLQGLPFREQGFARGAVRFPRWRCAPGCRSSRRP